MSKKIKESDKIFNLDIKFKDPFRKKLFSVVKGSLEWMFSLKGLNKLYSDAKKDGKDQDRFFFEQLLETMNTTYQMTERDLERLPKDGKAVVVANHPFGGIEGIILGSIFRSIRPDSKIMANYLLNYIPETRDLFFFVDPFGGKEAARNNIRSLRSSMEHVEDGGLLGIFPAGEVSHLKLFKGKIIDPDWSTTVARIVRKTKAPVIPIYFNGFNGALFQLAGLLHPRLRTAMLPRELLNKKDKQIEIRVGKQISWSKLKDFEDDASLTEYIRQRTYMLQNRVSEKNEKKASFSLNVNKQKMEPIIDPVEVDDLVTDVENLPKEQMLLENAEYAVYHAGTKQIPNIMREIGRLREHTFRDTQEGTGKSIDIDEFDEYYDHLFVWHKDKHEIVGAYRLGRTDLIMEKFGKKGLYTTTLFDMKSSLFDQINPALEMGRSFVSKKYQRSFAPLLLLWKGIGHFVAKFPKYKILFGPVSINKEYHSFSRHLMVTFLTMNNYLPDLAKMVKPKMPFKTKSIKGIDTKNKTIIEDIDDVSELISEFEKDEKGVPILLKQYLKLGGKLLGFNVDPNFSDVLDGLILVDLTKTDPQLLRRYLSDEGMKKFYEIHNVTA